MIIQELKKNPIDFGVLFFALLVLAGLFLRFSHLPQVQQLIIWLGVVFYFLWGIVHHRIRGDLCLKVVLEYFLIGLIVGGGGMLVLSRI